MPVNTHRSYTDEFKHQAVEVAQTLGPARPLLPVSWRDRSRH